MKEILQDSLQYLYYRQILQKDNTARQTTQTDRQTNTEERRCNLLSKDRHADRQMERVFCNGASLLEIAHTTVTDTKYRQTHTISV